MSRQYFVGIEIEVDTHPRIVQYFPTDYGLITHDDGSIRKTQYSFYNYPVSYFNANPELLDLFCRRHQPYGTELTTGILPEKKAMEFMKMIRKTLSHVPAVNPSASIHIHVDVRNEPWMTIYKVLLLFYILEAPFYRMACADTRHRGWTNDFLYCRPISNPIGIYRSDAEGLMPCVDIPKFLTAQNATELLQSWGYVHMVPRGRHYISHRLMGINLRSVLERGSLEWRIFDGRYEYATAFLHLVLATHRAATQYNVTQLQQLAQEKAWLFGKAHRISVYDVYSILFPQARSSAPAWLLRLWGQNEITRFACRQLIKESHYDNRNRYIVETAPYLFTNNNHDVDDGSALFPLYVDPVEEYTEEE